MVAISGPGWTLAPSLKAYVDEADDVFPNRDRASDGSIGDLAHSARKSDHNPQDGWVHAIDLDENLAAGVTLLPMWNHLITVRDPRVAYLIYEDRIVASYATGGVAPWTPRPYTGPNEHRHHMHLSILRTAAARNDLRPWGFEAVYFPAPPPEPEPEPEPTPAPLGAAVSFYHVVATNRYYGIGPAGIVKLTAAEAYEIGTGGAPFVRVQTLATWNKIATGLPVAS